MDDMDLQYFAIAWGSWTCDEFYVSTAPSATFSASTDSGDSTDSADSEQLPIEGDQHVCIFQLSSSRIDFSGSYSIEPGVDKLSYWGLNAAEDCTGVGDFSGNSHHITSFWWQSVEHNRFASFVIRFDSRNSSLPAYRWRGEGNSSVPVILTAVEIPQSRSASQLRATPGLSHSASQLPATPALSHSASELPSLPRVHATTEDDDSLTGVYIGVGIGGGVALIIILIVVGIAYRRRTRSSSSSSSSSEVSDGRFDVI
jgi:hypothetical protein